jgi:hypothetical protein
VGITILVIMLVRRRRPRLRWWQRLLGLIGVTALAIVASGIEYAAIGINSDNVVSNFVFGSIVCSYGLLLAAISVW